MADTVQYRLERMLRELEDLEKRGLFTKQELAEIVKRRRKFEYKLKRPSPLKQDFLAYVEYETHLDALRRLRKKSVVRELKKEGKKESTRIMKMSVSDYAGVTRVLDIYRLAVTRFKGDVELWFRYLEFCRAHRNGRMKKVLAQVLRFHPKVPGVWIYAAAWEFDHNLNVAAARALMQSGLRVCPTSEELWVEYLRMELTYLNKLKARKVALGEDKGSLVRDKEDADEKQWRDENKELYMSLDEGKESDEGMGLNVENEETENQARDLFREQGLNILRTVYGGAIEAIPRSFDLRKQLFEIFEGTELAHSEDMRKEILGDMKRDFAKDPEYWDWIARLEMKGADGEQGMRLNKAIEVYEEALHNVPFSTMYELYSKFLMNFAAPERGKFGISSAPSSSDAYISRLLQVYKKAETSGCLDEDLACEYVSFYLQLGRLADARNVAEKLCSGKLSNSMKLWILRASLEAKCFTWDASRSGKADLSSVFELLRGVLVKASVKESEELWLMALKFFAAEKQYFDKLVEMALIAVTKDGGSENGFSLPCAIINYVLQMDGVDRCRELYKRFLGLPHPGLALYRSCIKLEENLASIGDKNCLANTRRLYELVLGTYDQDVGLWRDYYAMEVKVGTAETANAVYWRARKTLRNAAEFMASSSVV